MHPTKAQLSLVANASMLVLKLIRHMDASFGQAIARGHSDTHEKSAVTKFMSWRVLRGLAQGDWDSLLMATMANSVKIDAPTYEYGCLNETGFSTARFPVRSSYSHPRNTAGVGTTLVMLEFKEWNWVTVASSVPVQWIYVRYIMAAASVAEFCSISFVHVLIVFAMIAAICFMIFLPQFGASSHIIVLEMLQIALFLAHVAVILVQGREHGSCIMQHHKFFSAYMRILVVTVHVFALVLLLSMATEENEWCRELSASCLTKVFRRNDQEEEKNKTA